MTELSAGACAVLTLLLRLLSVFPFSVSFAFTLASVAITSTFALSSVLAFALSFLRALVGVMVQSSTCVTSFTTPFSFPSTALTSLTYSTNVHGRVAHLVFCVADDEGSHLTVGSEVRGVKVKVVSNVLRAHVQDCSNLHIVVHDDFLPLLAHKGSYAPKPQCLQANRLAYIPGSS